MNEKLYQLMDWAAIEAVVYSEENNPHSILGPTLTSKGLLIQTFIPTARKVSVKLANVKREYPMEIADEAGFFAVLISRKDIPAYYFKVEYDNGTVKEYADPYRFAPWITVKEEQKFTAGRWYDCYQKLGAHPVTLEGVAGVYFAVWAPNAMRVSLVGDFILWDGRRLPMRRLEHSGIFELFVPGLSAGVSYKYEIKAKGDRIFLKADPYANGSVGIPELASEVADLAAYQWNDRKYLQAAKGSSKQKPLLICEMDPGRWCRKEDGESYNFRELAPLAAAYLKEQSYTHVQLMPIMEYPQDHTLGYETSGYYTPSRRYGDPEDFMYFVDYLHQNGIGVILDWVPAYFSPVHAGMGGFDGTALYEHLDPRQGIQPKLGTFIYNYGRPEVRNFLLANILFWSGKYHIDGIRMTGVTTMLYLDYDRQEGEWIPNIYGGNENLEAIEFIKELNQIRQEQAPELLMIAEEISTWPNVTEAVENDGLGFDYKWNTGWKTAFLDYLTAEPAQKSQLYGEFIFSMIYAYSEDFILPLSHNEFSDGSETLLRLLPGDTKQQAALWRAGYSYMMMHPGKKLLFSGGQEDPQLQIFTKALHQFYNESKALYEWDYREAGFEWINAVAPDQNILSFIRRGKAKDDLLLVVCNFSATADDRYQIGVPKAGKYKEVWNSDRKEFGGSGSLNPRLKQSKKEEQDGRKDSITIKLPAMAVVVLSYRKAETKAKAPAAAPKAKKNLKKELEDKYVEARSERKG